MPSHEWQFRLAGDEFDVSALTELFSRDVVITKDKIGATHLYLPLPYDSGEPDAARNAGEDLLAKLNATAHVLYGNHQNVRIAGIGLKDPNGGLPLLIVGAGGIRSRSRVGIGLVITGGSGPPSTPPTPGNRYLTAADKSEHFDRALYLLGTLPLDWRGLYMVLEAAEDGNGKERGLIAKGWVPEGRIKDFKATANSYKALRHAARHGTTSTGIELPSITLPEAYEMVRAILEKWSKELV